MFLTLYGCLHEVNKERVWAGHCTLIFRMELDANKPGMTRQLNDLDKVFVRVDPDCLHASLFKLGQVLIIELKTVAMPLRNLFLPVNTVQKAILPDVAWVCSQPHCTSFIADLFLIFHVIDDRVRAVRQEFC